MSAYGGGRIVYDGLMYMLDMYDKQSWISGSNYWHDKTGNTDAVDIYASHSQFDSDGYPIFDGTDPTALYWDNSDVRLLQNDYTVQFWFRRDGDSGAGGGGGGSNAYHTLLSGIGDSQVIIGRAGDRFLWWGRIGSSIYHSSGVIAGLIPVGEWIFYTFVKTSYSGSYLWFNDEIQSTNANYTASLDNSAKGRQTIGRNDNYVPNGSLPIAMVYNRVLSDDEIKANYLSSKRRFK